MRRIWTFVLIFVLIFSFATGVSATSAPSVGTYATVTQDGSCQVNMTVRIHLDQVVSDLMFPVPGDATHVALNGHRVSTHSKNGTRQINLSDKLGDLMGDITVTISYSLSNVVHTTEAEQLQLQIPLLSGFAYPVDTVEFSVTLPGAVEAKPAFSSGYHQADIEKDLAVTVSGATVSGTSQKQMKDHETLVMTLLVSEEMFPQTKIVLPDLKVLNVLMGVFAGLALVYWLIFLRCRPYFSADCPTPPEGITAGQVGSILNLSGADLTLMVLSWAQLGYILIQLDKKDRVTLYKRMDMGNERGEFERRCFKLLFGKRSSISANGASYGALCQRVGKMQPPVQNYFRPHSGNPLFFRLFAAGIGLFGGIHLGISLSAGAALQWFLAILMAILGAYSAWLIHNWALGLYRSDKRPLWISLGCCGGWILFGILAGHAGLAFLVCASQLMCGLMAAFGGLRTEEGRQLSRQLLGLRRYLRRVDKQELSHICEKDPDYFHNLAPYAIAMGVDETFSRRFGKIRLSECPYLTVGNKSTMTAAEWSALLQRTVSVMKAAQVQNTSNNLLLLLRSIIKP